MVISCCVENCSNETDNADDPNAVIQFHRFPILHEDLTQKWLAAIQKENFTPSTFTFVCSDHFLDTDYKWWGGMRQRLKPEAVPSVFNFPPEEAMSEELHEELVTKMKTMGKPIVLLDKLKDDDLPHYSPHDSSGEYSPGPSANESDDSVIEEPAPKRRKKFTPAKPKALLKPVKPLSATRNNDKPDGDSPILFISNSNKDNAPLGLRGDQLKQLKILTSDHDYMVVPVAYVAIQPHPVSTSGCVRTATSNWAPTCTNYISAPHNPPSNPKTPFVCVVCGSENSPQISVPRNECSGITAGVSTINNSPCTSAVLPPDNQRNKVRKQILNPVESSDVSYECVESRNCNVLVSKSNSVPPKIYYLSLGNQSIGTTSSSMASKNHVDATCASFPRRETVEKPISTNTRPDHTYTQDSNKAPSVGLTASRSSLGTTARPTILSSIRNKQSFQSKSTSPPKKNASSLANTVLVPSIQGNQYVLSSSNSLVHKKTFTGAICSSTPDQQQISASTTPSSKLPGLSANSTPVILRSILSQQLLPSRTNLASKAKNKYSSTSKFRRDNSNGRLTESSCTSLTKNFVSRPNNPVISSIRSMANEEPLAATAGLNPEAPYLTENKNKNAVKVTLYVTPTNEVIGTSVSSIDNVEPPEATASLEPQVPRLAANEQLTENRGRSLANENAVNISVILPPSNVVGTSESSITNVDSLRATASSGPNVPCSTANKKSVNVTCLSSPQNSQIAASVGSTSNATISLSPEVPCSTLNKQDTATVQNPSPLYYVFSKNNQFGHIYFYDGATLSGDVSKMAEGLLPITGESGVRHPSAQTIVKMLDEPITTQITTARLNKVVSEEPGTAMNLGGLAFPTQSGRITLPVPSEILTNSTHGSFLKIPTSKVQVPAPVPKCDFECQVVYEDDYDAIEASIKKTKAMIDQLERSNSALKKGLYSLRQKFRIKSKKLKEYKGILEATQILLDIEPAAETSDYSSDS